MSDRKARDSFGLRPGEIFGLKWSRLGQVDAASGSILEAHKVNHPGGSWTLRTPVHAVDAALRIQALSAQ